MKTFSKEQIKAIEASSKHTAVIAGAGTGKTTVLIERIKYLISLGINPKDILAITFTKKAAKEMQHRLNNNDVHISTFDAFCYHIVDLKDKELLVNCSFFTKKELLSFNIYDINFKKGLIPKKYQDYIKYKQVNKLVDFNDLEYLALKTIKEKSISFDYILVDEFQDTNNLQYSIFESLISKETKTFIVGDPDQSIYRFRGANNSLIKKYIIKYQAKEILLTTNYRSNRSIISLANNLISNNSRRIRKTLIANNDNSGTITLSIFNNDDLEYNDIINVIKDLLLHFNSIAILFRNHEQGYYYYKEYYNNSRVSVMTIHESKGLEFDVVFLIGINNNIIPSKQERSLNNIEEERRLFFVAITRAKKSLYISTSNKQSMFIKELKIKRK